MVHDIAAPAVVSWRLRDKRIPAFARRDAMGRSHWLSEMQRTIELLGNATLPAVWVPFNEGLAQFDAVAVADQIKRLDPSRAVDHVSGWHDQGTVTIPACTSASGGSACRAAGAARGTGRRCGPSAATVTGCPGTVPVRGSSQTSGSTRWMP